MTDDTYVSMHYTKTARIVGYRNWHIEKQKYIEELNHNQFTPEFVENVKLKLAREDVLFLYGAKNQKHNQAVVLKEYVEKKLKI